MLKNSETVNGEVINILPITTPCVGIGVSINNTFELATDNILNSLK